MAMMYYYITNYLTGMAKILDKNSLDIPKDGGGNPVTLSSSTVENVLKVVFGVAGGVAVIMIVLGGFKYISSLGNAQNVAKAKDTILYAVIGLVVCIAGYAIVQFVVTGVT